MRYEFKYLVSNSQLNEMRDALIPYLDYDKFAIIRPDKEYTVRSVYFDSLRMEAYFEKLDGYKIRKKLRIRSYNELQNDSVAFLEIKRKDEQLVSKNRALFLFRDLEDLLETGDVENYILKRDCDSIGDANRFLFHMNKSLLKPLVVVTYEREAFLSKFDSDIRITFDKNIRTSVFRTYNDLFDESRMKLVIKDKYVLEVKFNKRFSPILQNVISRFNLTRTAVSKYQSCIDADPAMFLHIASKRLLFNNPVWAEKEYQKEAI